MTARACQSFNVWCVASREAQIEKKMARREAARERDASPDIVKLPGGGDVMGGDDSLEAAKARHAPFPLRLVLGVPKWMSPRFRDSTNSGVFSVVALQDHISLSYWLSCQAATTVC